QAEHCDEQQGGASADRGLGRQNELPASFGLLRKRLDPRLDVCNLVGRIVVFYHRTLYLQLSWPSTKSSAVSVGRTQTYQPLAAAGICCAQDSFTGPSAD